MEFTNTFTIPLGIDDAFAVLTDLEQVAPCMPGAKLEEVQDDTYTGRVKVKLGPMSLTYRGTAAVVKADPEAHTATIEAKGNEARGGGTASADVTASMTEVADGTEVTVVTALNITGKPAQFGRGVMGDVGARIIDAFADCLSRKLSAPDGEDADADEDSADTSDTASAAADDTQAAADASAPSGEASTGARRVVGSEPEVEALDLADVAGAATLKRAAPVIGGLLAAFVVWRLVRRRRGRD